MFIELIAAKGCYETFWGILSVLYAPFTNMSGFFFFYLQNVSQKNKSEPPP